MYIYIYVYICMHYPSFLWPTRALESSYDRMEIRVERLVGNRCGFHLTQGFGGGQD